jgi:hypothetical protein
MNTCSEKDSEISDPHQFEPFGGLVPDTVKGRVLAEIVADPFSEYTPKKMGDLIDNHPRYALKAMQELAEIGLVRHKCTKGRQPVFEACKASKRLTALTLLALAVKDDELGENCMDDAICDHVRDLGFIPMKNKAIGVQTEDDKGQSYTVIARSTESSLVWGLATMVDEK